ncbi:lactoylglutathione lyase-like lyase [Xenococcus sp. PCC 7305]|uniref:VOC family protein n=1 Tax=Xenococcus sp. PCC 7305 TaxID=102125 RepID=UPI0002ABAF13|nr:VOC family protein [Xenococcus sp. PCC 7305]ELS05252.1 lactoylglutathione lyase-like lyase [Xenococcus sp. PCC 7305]
MQIRKCLHTSILVSDLQQAKTFYGDILNLPQSTLRNLNFPGLWYQLGDYQIHIIEDQKFINQNCINPEKWGRNPHLALAVDDLAMVEAKLHNNGYAIQKSFSGRQALFTKDRDGNIIELVQT